ncbi:rhomboid family intramembrane serine protease [Rhizobium terrae]|uniref:rhomboid family intramembrane serine protease n=1 Tax=Rhizobium terrae TaxID=2171756 RepID=UPI001D00A2CB|nr:rhomboid family intramembrane serine protease [Rhizobium terrae]
MTDTNNGPEGADEGQEAEAESSQPVFNLPQSLVITLALLVAIYVVQEYLLDDETRLRFILRFAFIPFRDPQVFGEQGPEWLWAPVTYSFLHGSVEHILFNGLWLMAFGAPVVRRIGTLRYVLFWAFSAAAAAGLHALLAPGDITPLIGASGVVSALMGAACRFAFPGERGYDRTYGHLYPRQSIKGSFRNRTVVIFTAMWFAGNLLIAFGVTLFGADMGPIAWDAHIGGFLFGFLLFGLFDPLPPSRTAITQP